MIKYISIYYFSATGNTEYLLKGIAKKLRENQYEVGVYSIESSPEYKKNDLIIIGYPVFAWREPYNITRLISNLPDIRGIPVIAFYTYGGIKGNSVWRVKKLIEKRGGIFKGAVGVRCEDSHPVLRRKWTMMFVKKGKPDEKDIEIAYKKLIKIIKSKKKEKVVWNPVWFFLDIISKIYQPPYIDKWFKKWVIKEKCIKCGLCEKYCPEKIIKLSPYPEFYKGCIGCYRCINICPTSALLSYFVKGGMQYRRFLKSKI